MSFAYNGTALVSPVDCTVTVNDLSASDSGRSIDGTMMKKFICDKRTVKLSWKMLSVAETATLLALVKADVYGTFTYPDPYDGTDRTITAYTGDPEVKHHTNDYRDVELSFIEQ